VLSGRGLCDELIARAEECYRLWCVVVCDLETSRICTAYIYIYDISTLRVNERQNLTELIVICTIAGECRKLTLEPCGPSVVYWNQSQEVETLVSNKAITAH
jgi:hypothetical protein